MAGDAARGVELEEVDRDRATFGMARDTEGSTGKGCNAAASASRSTPCEGDVLLEDFCKEGLYGSASGRKFIAGRQVRPSVSISGHYS